MNARTNILARIRSFRGIFKRELGEKPATQELLEDRAWEKAHDEEKYRRWEARLRRRKPAEHRKGDDT